MLLPHYWYVWWKPGYSDGKRVEVSTTTAASQRANPPQQTKPGYVPTMPVVDVEIVGSCELAGLAQVLAVQIGSALGSAEGGTWVKVRLLAQDRYAENRTDHSPQPVFVKVLQRHRLTGDALTAAIVAITQIVADATNRPAESVHLVFSESAAGRVSFGGKLVE